jgi:NAD-dependent dihydropyrimidine dehydrogenase PreA subunit
MSEEVYQRLRVFMDTLPAGYPETPTGVEIKILKKLFTPEEAELTMKLKAEPEEIPAISRRIGMEKSELAHKLEQLARKGLIFRIHSGDRTLYQAFQFVVGVYEFQLKHLDKEFCELFEEYLPYLGASMMSIQTRQMRVIPVESAVGRGQGVSPYNRVRELVKEQKVFAVQDCICRKEQALLGHGCSYPREICLGFGDFARYYIDNTMAREISREECLGLLDKAEASGLVLCPTNTRELASICCCCSCCCPVLKFAKMAPRPADLVQSHYESKIDPDLCTACGDCIERCPMGAIQEGDGSSVVVDGRCIGCGLCVSTCPAEAITLAPKPGMEEPPKDLTEMMKRIATERGVR